MNTTVANASTRALLRYCESRAIDVGRLISGAGLERRLVVDPDARLDSEQMFAVWGEAQREVRDEIIGLRVAELVPFGAYRALDYLLMASPSLREAIRKSVRYFHLANGGADLHLSAASGGRASLELHHAGAPREHIRRSAEYTFTILLARFRLATGVRLRPAEVHFTFKAPPAVSDYHRIFQAPVRFNQPVNRLVFDEASLGLPHPGADPSLCEVLEHHARQTLAGLQPGVDFLAQVRRALDAGLRRGDAKVASVARELAMSERSLQRRLNSEATSFREVLDEVRADLSLRLLGENEMDVREVAFTLGFSEPSAFYRAFRRWTGKTPAAYRGPRA
ncbi:MAG TPA: AraC family transcriptional regulator [Pyrinomonadaceae bacterium]|nr:AraC family transcriptional regulator [Pyrinomonadaceae bacterium]